MSDAPAPTDAPAPPADRLSVTRHRVRIGGEEIAYTVTAGTMVLREETEASGEKEGRREGETPKAEVFFVAYTRDGVDDPAGRPVTFSFNGGPGSSSVWLHLGVLGPRRVALDDEGFAPPPPYRLADNEHALLDVSDLVFIDPVGTGFSRAVTGEKAKEFHGFTKDIESVGDFIRLWSSRYGRWLSPKFLAGESYGTTRAAGLSEYLQTRHGMFLNGLMLISSVLDFATLRFGPGNDLPPLLYLPSYTATAHFHGALEPDLQARPLPELLEEVERFALERYAPALLRGADLPDEERDEIARQLARYTGLSEAYVRATDLRIDILRFCKELLRHRGLTVGRLDSRYTGIDRDAAGERFEFDPAYAAIQGPYTACFNDYVRRELRFESDLPYEVLAGLYETWSYKEFEGRYVNVAESLRKALSLNPHLRVHVATGLYDLATPYFASAYTVAHLGLATSQRGSVTTSTYEAGHMMYVRKASLEKLKGELGAFVEAALPSS